MLIELFTTSVQNHLQQLNGSNMKQLFLISILVIYVLFVYPQAATTPNVVKISDKTEVVDGVKYYFHVVESGNTLYSISKAYGVNTIDIIKLNPTAEFGIKLGEILKIPSTGNVNISSNNSDGNGSVLNNTEYTYHIVKDKENLSSIGGIYGVTEKQIMSINPTIKEPLTKGDLLKIPIVRGNEIDFSNVGRTAKSDIVAEVSNAMKNRAKIDTLVDFAPQNILFDSGEAITVALFIPLHFSQVDRSISEMVDCVVRRTSDLEGFKYLGIYEGMMVAINQLAENGLKIRFLVYDAGRDLNATANTLKEPELLKTDIIFSFTYYESFKLIDAFAKLHRIPVVNGLSSRRDIIKGNPFMFKVTPNPDYVTKSLSEYIASQVGDSRIIIAKTKSTESESMAEVLNKNLLAAGYSPVNKAVVYSDELMSEVGKLPETMVKGVDIDSLRVTKNIVVLVGTSEVFIMNALRNLSKVKSKGCMIFGLPPWTAERQNAIAATDVNYVKNMNLRLIADRSIEYNNQLTEQFVTDFNELFEMSPDNSAMQSYDLTMFFVAAMKEYGDDFYSTFPKLFYDGIYSGYHFINTEGGGYENVFWNIYRYKNYNILNLNRNN